MHQILPGQPELHQHSLQEPEFAKWIQGYGPIQHNAETQAAVYRLAHQLVQAKVQPDLASVYKIFTALDKLTAAAMWLVVHMTYAKRVRLDGSAMQAEDFKTTPEGHTGGALNIVPAYAGYLAINALTAQTRAWMMGQGHCVAAIEALNVFLGNLHPEQESVYAKGEQGLNQLIRDFYGYALAANGSNAAPLGSHVNPHTAGGIFEGGYLGFAELQYVHKPLVGEKLVTFLSDGAAEEQRGSDWIPRWWRAEDSGVVTPIMIANGRRIEQRTLLGTEEGLNSFEKHLRGCGFDPIEFDGRDPAAFACTIWEMEQRLERRVQEKNNGILKYPLPIPYGIAQTEKGFGFYGAGTNAAHNLPLPASPAQDERSRELFNQYAKPLWVEQGELQAAIALFKNHTEQNRPLERDTALAKRKPKTPVLPKEHYHDESCSPMSALDKYFVDLVAANPDLRPRVGNPDELASNRLSGVLKALRHRVVDPESELEAIDGKVITALNEEAVISACLANQGGLNLAASYEAFCVKMLGALRQSIIFARLEKEAGRPAQWISWPTVATSHTWENGKNQQSHQDTTFCEALLGEMSDVSRVLFPADHNSMLALLPTIYGSRGQINCIVSPKRDRPCYFNEEQAKRLAKDGAIVVKEFAGTDKDPVLLIACGSYQLEQVLRASERLEEAGMGYRVVYLQEPSRYRVPRDEWECEVIADDAMIERIFPERYRLRVLLTHMRPEVARGHLWALLPEAQASFVLGYKNRGGTLDEFGLQFANRACWANVVAACAYLQNIPRTALLTNEEALAVSGKGNPEVLR
ncbi:xylulose 5-phosphate 3-epimerase [Pseudomonas sp. F1_0610]|uniref:xylulose 5-phosphate 3-epimerase n=1 Tax=Pseudomonas sp. F1_0610 TaxID=3114284 RepID=UPI0039C0EA89